jgi:acyl-CoA synthetase (AMP-forming)/AMP-acid ligase II
MPLEFTEEKWSHLDSRALQGKRSAAQRNELMLPEITRDRLGNWRNQALRNLDETEPRTVIDVLVRRAVQDPHRLAYRYVDRHGQVQESSHAHLFASAQRIAVQLASMGAAGQRVLLACDMAANFVPGFYGCMMAGAVAVPAPAGANRRLAERTALLVKDVQPVALLCDTTAMTAIGSAIDLPMLDLRAQATPIAQMAPLPVPASFLPGPSSIAFIQYSSGSTDEPKGVMVTHENVLANCRVIFEGIAMGPSSRMLAPLPLFHDMGLVGGILATLFCGCESTLLDPLRVIQKPLAWLTAISQYCITHCGGPNFLYEMALEAADDPDTTIDLASWKVAICSAEPVRASTMQRFCQRFANSGFAATSFYPSYGLAESTLFVTGVTVGSGPVFDDELPPSARTGCGRTYGDTELAIVDPKTLSRPPDGREGEIWVRGASVAAGYWGRPALSVKTGRQAGSVAPKRRHEVTAGCHSFNARD